MKKDLDQKKKKITAKSLMQIDYKDPVSLYKYIADGGKIVPARISKLKISQQRLVNYAVKKSRNLGLLPIGMGHFDSMSKIEQINPVLFEV
ncbi:MAG: 30S ribosomal protein S18 [Deltaproteobacteria bacterium]|jgi:small subunit ribosomal protein S18|nr:30S ribosomal protein S18 [Deltaproteobacteria bacterium]